MLFKILLLTARKKTFGGEILKPLLFVMLSLVFSGLKVVKFEYIEPEIKLLNAHQALASSIVTMVLAIFKSRARSWS